MPSIQVGFPNGQGTGATTFLALDDTPSAFTGMDGKILAYDLDTDKIVFIDAPAQGGDVTDAPADGKTYNRQYGVWVPAASSLLTYRRWRLFFTQAGSSFTGGAVGELEFRDANGTRIPTLGAAIAQSDSFGAKANAFDQNSATFWAGASGTIPGSGYLGFYFDSPTWVHSYKYQARPDQASQTPVGWKLQYSPDGTTWVDADEVASEAAFSNGEIRTYTNTGVQPGGVSETFPDVTGNAGKVLAVATGETALEWVTPSGGTGGGSGLTIEDKGVVGASAYYEGPDFVGLPTVSTTAIGSPPYSTGALDSVTNEPIYRFPTTGSSGSNGVTWEVTNTAGELLYLRYKNSSEVSYDYMVVKVNGTQVFSTISKTNDIWYEETIAMPAGTNSIQIYYRKDGSGDVGDDTVYFSRMGFSRVAAGPFLAGNIVTYKGSRYIAVADTSDGPDAAPASWVIVSKAMGKSTKTASYVLSNSDIEESSIIYVDVASVATITVPPGLVGTQPITLVNKTLNEVSLVAGAGVTIQSADAKLKLRTQFSSASLIPQGNNVYLLIGDLAT
jgi:hypothetical protein